ncbi:hypothetical protein A8F94_02410 [Bacillus sp. FJAT-27225]|uniref:helix-turn-helix domain-containing protein n=1 Tax=Bacillus sp. FJAT-27225 TaxID=1743144 RepID=UPI00080C2AB8|nr:helix-turn-helix domain-containing protein [Bacillus sp. FJAT-27225]OCA90750.1 hypothetical protein A8F94_02410 [Bacillus sp. FJAT-27225]
MKEQKADLILHPVRMRIIQSLLNRDLTTQEMKEYLPEVPQATLYRQLKKLVDGKVIRISAERPIRGTVEKVYSMSAGQGTIGGNSQENESTDDYLSYFIKFTANLIGEFESYLQKGNVDLYKDGVSFRQASLYLDDEEFARFVKDLSDVFVKVISNKPGEGKKRRTVATIIIPEGDIHPAE